MIFIGGLDRSSVTTCATIAPPAIEDKLIECGDELMKKIKLNETLGVRNPSEGLIIVTADDRSGKIKIFRNGGSLNH